MRLIIAVAVLWFSSLAAHAQTYTWTGTNSGLWSDAGNWSGGTPVNGIDTRLIFNNAVNLAVTQDITVTPAAMVLNRMSFPSSAGAFNLSVAPSG
jgi:hypothetical protein